MSKIEELAAASSANASLAGTLIILNALVMVFILILIWGVSYMAEEGDETVFSVIALSLWLLVQFLVHLKLSSIRAGSRRRASLLTSTSWRHQPRSVVNTSLRGGLQPADEKSEYDLLVNRLGFRESDASRVVGEARKLDMSLPAYIRTSVRFYYSKVNPPPDLGPMMHPEDELAP